MSVPASQPFPPPAHKEPYFKGAFFWYVVLQVLMTTVIAAGTFVYFFTAGALYPENLNNLIAQATSWESVSRGVGFVLTLLLCIAVAKRHEIGSRGVGLFFAGNITSTIICVPMIAYAVYGNTHPTTTWAATYFAGIIVYGIACGVLIYRRRRQQATRRSQREVVEVFD